MRRVEYTDTDGRKWVTMIPDSAPARNASMGYVVGPPLVEVEGWPEELCIRVQNALVDAGIITWHDFRSKRKLAVGAVNGALGSMVSKVEMIYRLE